MLPEEINSIVTFVGSIIIDCAFTLPCFLSELKKVGVNIVGG